MTYFVRPLVLSYYASESDKIVPEDGPFYLDDSDEEHEALPEKIPIYTTPTWLGEGTHELRKMHHNKGFVIYPRTANEEESKEPLHNHHRPTEHPYELEWDEFVGAVSRTTELVEDRMDRLLKMGVKPIRREMAELYGLYKQVVIGDNYEERPDWEEEPEERYRWECWFCQKNLFKADAERRFVMMANFLLKKYTGWNAPPIVPSEEKKRVMSAF